MPSKIEWLTNPDGTPGETWNVLAGCDHKSDGCTNCWAARMARRQVGMRNKNYYGTVKGGKWTGKIKLIPDALEKPLHWRKPRRIFVQSMGDLFHEKVPFEFIDKVFAAMALCPQHTFMVLTKRPERMREYVDDREQIVVVVTRKHGAEMVHKGSCDQVYRIVRKTDPARDLIWPLPNVHLYTSIEDQATADERIPWLLKTPAAVRGVSLEPMLGPVDFSRTWMDLSIWMEQLDHVIVGGESGPGARPIHPDWVRSVRDQCIDSGTAYFFKQWGEWTDFYHHPDGQLPAFAPERKKLNALRTQYVTKDGHRDGVARAGSCKMVRVGKRAAGRMLDGRTWDEMPGQAREG